MNVVSLLNLVLGQLAVTVGVQVLKHASEFFSLLLADKLRADESKSSSLDGGVRVEVNQIIERSAGNILIDIHMAVLLNPRVLHRLLGGGALLGVVSQQLGNEIFGVRADGGPNGGLEVKFTGANGGHDLGVGAAIKWRDAGQNDISHDTEGPDVALLAVVVVQHLGRNVVGSTDSLLLLLAGLKLHGSTEVNNLDLVELLGGLKQDILGLEISVHNVEAMAVADAGEQLSHEHGGIMLVELAAGNDLVKELATLNVLSHDVVALIVLEVLKDLHNVGVVKATQSVDLV